MNYFTISDAARMLKVTRQRAGAMLAKGQLTRITVEGLGVPRVANDAKLKTEIKRRMNGKLKR